MRQSQVRAWILLAVPNEPKPLPYVLGMADGLNKAIPMLDELTDSLGWLRAAKLIVENAGEFHRTDTGRKIIASCKVDGNNAFDLWDKLESVLETMRVDVAPGFELTAEELQEAYDEYHNRFWATNGVLD